MTRTMAIVAAAVIAGGATAAHAAKPYNGNYLLTFYVDPGSNPGSSYCLGLTQESGINGFSNSGTFVDNGGSGLSGEFIVDGKSLHLVVISSPFGDSVDLIGKAGKSPSGEFDDFGNGIGLYDSGTYTLTPGCTDGAKRPSTHRVTTY